MKLRASSRTAIANGITHQGRKVQHLQDIAFRDRHTKRVEGRKRLFNRSADRCTVVHQFCDVALHIEADCKICAQEDQ